MRDYTSLKNYFEKPGTRYLFLAFTNGIGIDNDNITEYTESDLEKAKLAIALACEWDFRDAAIVYDRYENQVVDECGNFPRNLLPTN